METSETIRIFLYVMAIFGLFYSFFILCIKCTSSAARHLLSTGRQLPSSSHLPTNYRGSSLHQTSTRASQPTPSMATNTNFELLSAQVVTSRRVQQNLQITDNQNRLRQLAVSLPNEDEHDSPPDYNTVMFSQPPPSYWEAQHML